MNIDIKNRMLYLKITDKSQKVKFSAEGIEIQQIYNGAFAEGDEIIIRLDGVDYLSVRLDETLKKSFIYVPNRFYKFKIPNEKELKTAYHPDAFKGSRHLILAREVSEDEFYSERNISLNSHDFKQNSCCFPHAKANFVTRNEPCFYERNAIDGVINNQGHGSYPYHSWAGGAREDLEYTLQFGRKVIIDKIVFYLRADFTNEVAGVPHDSYWKSIDIDFGDDKIFTCRFKMLSDNLHKENSIGKVFVFDNVVTDEIKLKNFKQATTKLSFAALSQIEVFGKYIKEDKNIMELRQPSNAKDVKNYDTKRLREEFHIKNLFTKDNVTMVYSQFDRIITAGFMPVKQILKLEGSKELACSYFLERREMGCINIGGKGIITIDGVEYELNPRDGIYIGKGNKDITFKSTDENNPAKFYVNSCPAHKEYPTVKIDIGKARKVPCGSAEECNKRVINQYIHPDVIKSCQLAMGLTQLETGSNWNTMPCHTHDRRMEVYLYLDMGENDAVFHLMGEPSETRHIVIHNEEAVISPSWSIHSGVGTKNYSFIWAMCGENQEFTDMDFVETRDLL